VCIDKQDDVDSDVALHASELTPAQMLERVDKIVAAGRLTEEEGARLHAAAHSGGLDEELRKVRLRHAKARLQRSVESGRVSEDDAQRILERLNAGDDPRIVLGLRAQAEDHRR
jgi:CRISPR/Cas system-associated endoribonuclease Cas2